MGYKADSDGLPIYDREKDLLLEIFFIMVSFPFLLLDLQMNDHIVKSEAVHL